MYEKITYYSRMSQTLHVPVPVSGFTPTSPESAAWLARATDVTLLADKQAYDALITGLVNAGVWAKLDILYIFAAVDRTTAVLNLISSNFPASEVAYTANFTAYVGYTGDAAFYINTGYNPSTDGVTFTQNSASIGYYNKGAGTSNERMAGDDGGAGNVLTLFPNAFNTLLMECNGITSNTPAVTSANGFWLLSLTGGNSLDSYAFSSSSGYSGSRDSKAGVAAGIANQTLFIMAFDSNGSAINKNSADYTCTAAFVGGGLSNTEVGDLASLLNDYMAVYGNDQY